jgi:hypothetical protein
VKTGQKIPKKKIFFNTYGLTKKRSKKNLMFVAFMSEIMAFEFM